MTGTPIDDGTSAATPLWAWLIVSSTRSSSTRDCRTWATPTICCTSRRAIAPGSFNDVTFGNNIMSFVHAAGATRRQGQGHYAHRLRLLRRDGLRPRRGLGSPNGVLLARAMTAIAHSQISFRSTPDMLDADGCRLGERRRPEPAVPGHFRVVGTVGRRHRQPGFFFSGCASGISPGPTGWPSRSLQDDFDPRLVRMFDKQAVGWTAQSVSWRRATRCRPRSTARRPCRAGSLTSPFGFADFLSGDGAVRWRGGGGGRDGGRSRRQIAIVRVRQNGENDLSLSFYKVDDLSGTIAGKRPGEAGYAALVDARAYQLTRAARRSTGRAMAISSRPASRASTPAT